MSSKIADPPANADEAIDRATVPPDDGGWTVSTPLAASVLAGAVHQLVPNGQNLPMTWMDAQPIWLHPYPLLLEFVFALALVLAVAEAVWSPLRPWVRHHAPLVAGFVGVLLVWDVITQKLDWMPLPYFPGPNLVLASMIEDRVFLFESTLHSLRLLLAGYAMGVIAGVTTGVAIGWFPRVRYWGMPILKIVGPLPATALVPLVLTLFQDQLLPAMALIAFAVWFPVTMLTASGIASVRLSHIDVARTLGAGPWYLIFQVAVPSALPHVFIGLFMGLGASFLTLIVAESVGVKFGLGWYVNMQRGGMDYSKVYAALLIMMVSFSLLMTLLFKVRDWMLGWQKGVIKW